MRREVRRWEGTLAGVCAACAVATGEASAGAWPQIASEGLEISEVSRETGAFGEVWRAGYWVEYGLSDRWTGFAKLENEVRVSEFVDDRAGGLLGLRRSIWQAGRSALAFEGGLLFGEATEGLNCEGGGYEAKIAAGRSARLLDREAFVSLDAGWRERGGCGRFAASASAGFELTQHWRVLSSAWTDTGDGDRTATLEVGLQRQIGSFRLGLSYRDEISGAFDQSGVSASVWRTF